MEEFSKENAQPSADRYINKTPSLGSSSHIVARTYHRKDEQVKCTCTNLYENELEKGSSKNWDKDVVIALAKYQATHFSLSKWLKDPIKMGTTTEINTFILFISNMTSTGNLWLQTCNTKHLPTMQWGPVQLHTCICLKLAFHFSRIKRNVFKTHGESS